MCVCGAETNRTLLRARGWGPCRRGARALRRGFTLIEMMVVLVLIGILSAMIIPEMKGTYGDALLRGSARELVNVFSIAYSRAVSFNEVHVVRLQPSSGRYEIQRQTQGQRGPAEWVPLKDVAGSAGDLDSRIQIEVRKSNERDADTEGANTASLSSHESQDRSNPGPDTVSFYPDGTADATEVVLRDQAGFGLRLKIDPITARVEILQLDSETKEQRP